MEGVLSAGHSVCTFRKCLTVRLLQSITGQQRLKSWEGRGLAEVLWSHGYQGLDFLYWEVSPLHPSSQLPNSLCPKEASRSSRKAGFSHGVLLKASPPGWPACIHLPTPYSRDPFRGHFWLSLDLRLLSGKFGEIFNPSSCRIGISQESSEALHFNTLHPVAGREENH